MKPYLKFGLIVGAISLIVVVPISALMGICGPGVTMVAGAIAGFLSAYSGKALTRRDGAQSGAIAGAIAGGITLLGQLVAAVLALAFVQVTGTAIPFGRIPSSSSPAYEHVVYYGAGLGTGLCFGIIGIVLGAIAGGLAGAFGVRQLPPSIITPGSGEGT